MTEAAQGFNQEELALWGETIDDVRTRALKKDTLSITEADILIVAKARRIELSDKDRENLAGYEFSPMVSLNFRGSREEAGRLWEKAVRAHIARATVSNKK